jgi:shikimate dehydrogenase
MPKLIGLIGYPVKHSISPYLQQAALDYYQLDIRYELWETVPEKLESTMAGLRGPQKLGANVTTPYKEKVLPLLDEVDEVAKLIGAVNTIAKRDDKLVGFNTDALGFIEALDKRGHFDPKGKVVVILGAGGAARAVSFALVNKGVESLTIINRTFERAKTLANSLRNYITDSSLRSEGLKTEVAVSPWPSSSLRHAGGNLDKAFGHCHLIVNCTTIGTKYSSQEGQSPLSIEMIPRGVLVYDLVYNPSPTPLLQLAQEAGAHTLSGLAMLVYQGAASFELWTGREAPLDIMLNKAKEMLTGGKR